MSDGKIEEDFDMAAARAWALSDEPWPSHVPTDEQLDEAVERAMCPEWMTG